MKPFLPVMLRRTVLRSAAPATVVMAIATLLTGCNQQQQTENVSLALPDFHTPTYVGGQLSTTNTIDPHHHLRPHAATLNVALISRHAPHH